MRSDLKRHADPRGVTLVETLVATGIMAILLALSFASYRNVSGALDRSRCLTNLRGIGHASLTYASENQGRLPGPVRISLQTVTYTSRAETDPRTLTEFLRPYLELDVAIGGQTRIADVMVCPAGKKLVLEQGGTVETGRFYTQVTQALFEDPSVKQYPFGYRYSADNIVEPARLASVSQPSRVQLLRDGVANSAASKADPGIPWQQSHGTFYNAVFMDGHVETVPVP